MTQHNIALYILIASVFQVLFVILIIVLFTKLYKYKKEIKRNKKETEAASHRHQKMIDNRDELRELYHDTLNRLKNAIPDDPYLKHILYYNTTKEIEVHAIIDKLGIAVVSDIDKPNYSIRLTDELLDDVTGLGEEEELEED